jgi:hypothetical protein
MSDVDMGLVVLLLFAAMVFMFPGGPGTPLRMRADPQQ